MSAVEDPTDVIQPDAEYNVIVLGEGEDRLVLVQKPLTFFGKMEFFSVMGKALNKILSEGVSVGELLNELPKSEEGAPLNTESFREADLFITGIAKIVEYAPEILLDMYCVILAVPRGEREYVKYRLETELVDDEQGFKIIDTFIDQNWDVMVSFFVDKIMPLIDKVSKKMPSSEPSKPSKRTRKTTPKQ